MNAVDLPVSHVFANENARKIDRATVRFLMRSIEQLGIINPLRVRPARRSVNGEMADAYVVTAGGHRLEAAIKLNMATVPCIVVDDDDLHAELAMIDENLCRAELSDAERAAQTARRKAIYIELHPETAHGGDRKSDQAANLATCSTPSFVDATAQATGKSERAVRRDAERGEKIADDVLGKVAGTKLDTGVYLDKLKKLPPEEQRAKVEKDIAKPKPVKRPAEPLSDDDARDQWLATGMTWWNKGSAEWREAFLARIDQPVMDATRFGGAA